MVVKFKDGSSLTLGEAVTAATHVGERSVKDMTTEAHIDRAYLRAKDWVWEMVLAESRDGLLEALRGRWNQ